MNFRYNVTYVCLAASCFSYERSLCAFFTKEADFLQFFFSFGIMHFTWKRYRKNVPKEQKQVRSSEEAIGELRKRNEKKGV